MAYTKTIEYCAELEQFKSEFEDIHRRNIISRAYYHAFYEFRHHLEERLKWPIMDKKGGTHLRLYSRLSGYPEDQLNSEEVKQVEELKYRITALKKYRTKADYEISTNITKLMQDFATDEAKLLATEIEKI